MRLSRRGWGPSLSRWLYHGAERLPHKVGKSLTYWPDLSRHERYARLLVSQYLMPQGLTLKGIDGLDLPLPAPGAAGPLAGLKSL
jgi:hypothetical protein